MADFILSAGVKFNPRDVDTKAIREAVSKAVANARLSISRATFGRDAKSSLQKSFSNISFQVGKAKFAAEARRNLRDSFATINFNVSQARFGRESINGLRSQFSSLPFTVGKAKLSSKAQKQTAGGGAAGQASKATEATNRSVSASQRAVQAFRDQTIGLQALLTNTTSAQRGTQEYLRLLAQGGTTAQAFGAKIAQITTRFGAYLISLKALFAVQQAFSNSLRVIFEFDSALSNLQKVLKETPEGLQAVTRGLFEVAQSTGQSVTEAADSVGIFVRAGLDLEDALERTRIALVATNVTELSVAESTKFVTSAIQVFGAELANATEAVDILSFTADRFATTAGEVGRAFLRTASSAKTAGVSFNDLNAIVAATIEQTQLGGAQIGTALKTIFTRIISNSEALRKQANALGANIKPADSIVEIFGKLNAIFGRLSRSQKNQLSLLVAGRRQANIFTAAIDNFGKAQAIAAQQVDAAGTAAEKNAVQLETLSTKAQQVRNTFTELVVAITGVGRGEEGIGSIRDSLSALLDTANTIGQGFVSITSAIGDLGGGLVGVDSILKTLVKAAFFTVGVGVIRNIIIGFKTFLGLAGTAKAVLGRVASAEQGIGTQITKTNQLQEKTITAEQRRLQILKQIEATQVRITNASRTTAGQGGGARFANEADPERQRRSRNAGRDRGRQIAGGGALLGVQLLGDAAQRASVQFNATADELKRFDSRVSAGFTEAGATGAELGTAFGLMLGPLAGLTAGVIGAGISLLKFAFDVNVANAKALSVIENFGNRSSTFAQAVTEGGDFVRNAFIELAGAGADLDTVLVNEGVVFVRALSEAEKELGKFVKGLEKTVEDIQKSAEGVKRSTELGGQFRQADVQQNQRRIGLEFDIETGGLGREFSGLKKASSEVKAELEAFVGPLETAEELSQVMARVQRTVTQALSETNKTTSTILSENLLLSKTTREIAAEERKVLAEIRKQKDAGKSVVLEAQRLDKAIDALTNRLKEGKEILDGVEKTTADTAAIEQQLADAEKQRKGLREDLLKVTNLEKLADQALLKIQQTKTQQQEKEIKQLTEISVKFKSITEEAKLAALQIRSQTAALETQNRIAAGALSARKEVAALSVQANTLEEQSAARRSQIEQRLQDQIRNTQDIRSRAVSKLAAEEEVAAKAGQTARAAELKAAREEVSAAASEELTQLTEKARIEIETTLINEAQRDLERSEGALRNFRLNAIQTIVDREQQATNRRIQLIEQLGETGAGREFLGDNFRLSDEVQREFGQIGGIIVQELQGSTAQAVSAMVAEIDQLKVNGTRSFQELQDAERQEARAKDELARLTATGAGSDQLAKAANELQKIQEEIEQITAGGADAFAILRASQESFSDAVNLIEEETNRKRELALERLQKASEKVSTAEDALVKARNKIPQLNARVIQAQRGLAQANAQVTDAAEGLQQAYSGLADAQFRLNTQISLASFRASQAAGGFKGVQEQIGILQDTFSNLRAEVKASAGAILEARREIIQEELSLVRGQLQTVRSLALESATASPDEISRLQGQIGVGQAIAGGAAISQFPPELLQGIERLAPVIDGLEQQLLQQGAERLGLDPSVFGNFEDSLIELSTAIAETGQSQVNQAVEQVVAAQQQLAEAQEQKRVAEEQLTVSIGIREAAIANANQSASNLAVTRNGFGVLSRQTNRQLERLNQNGSTNQEALAALQLIKEEQTTATAQIEAQAEVAREVLGLNREQKEEQVVNTQEVAKVVEKQTATIGIIGKVDNTLKSGFNALENTIAELGGALLRLSQSSGGVSVSNNATGSLSSGEINGLIGAARREKRGMPGGSKLMLANTSEVVLTRKQASRIGLSPTPKAFAQDGNADSTGLQNVLSALTSVTSALTNKLNDPEAFQNNVNVQINSDDTVNVRGLDTLDTAVRQAFEQRASNFATSDKIKAIEDVVTAVVQKLTENGLTNSQGF